MYQVTAAVNHLLVGKSEDQIIDMFDCSDEDIDSCSMSSDQYADLFMAWVKRHGIKICRI